MATPMAALAETAARMPGLGVMLSDSIGQTVWEKFVALLALSAATALLRTRMGPILAHPETCALLRQLREEAMAVAQAAGQPLPAGLTHETMAKLALMPPQSGRQWQETWNVASRWNRTFCPAACMHWASRW